MNTQTYLEILAEEEYNKGFIAGEKSLQNACLVICDDFLYKTTRSVLNRAKEIMDEDHSEGIEYLVKNSTLIRNKRIESFNS